MRLATQGINFGSGSASGVGAHVCMEPWISKTSQAKIAVSRKGLDMQIRSSAFADTHPHTPHTSAPILTYVWAFPFVLQEGF